MPTISVSGSGLVGTTYTVSDGGVGNWQSYINDQWVNIPGAVDSTFTKTADAYEHPALRWLRSDGAASPAQPAYWSPINLPEDQAMTRWLDGLDTTLRVAADGRVSSVTDKFNGQDFTQSDFAQQPNDTVPLDLGSGGRRLLIPATAAFQVRWGLHCASIDMRTGSFADGALFYYAGYTGGGNDRKPMGQYNKTARIFNITWISSTGNGGVSQPVEDVAPHSHLFRVVDGVVRSSLDGQDEKTNGTNVTPQRPGVGGQMGDYRTSHPRHLLYTHITGRGILTDESLYLIQGWSAHRHGHPLPATHPYAASPPTVAGPVEPIIGAASVTLAAVTAIGAALLTIAGAGDAQLAPLTSASTASLAIAGQVTGTLAPLTASAVSVLPIQAQVGGMLAPVNGGAAGRLAITGQASAALAPLTGLAAANGEQANTGQASGQLSPVALSAAGRLDNTGTVTAILDSLIATATGVDVVDYDAEPRATVIVPSRQFAGVVPARQFSAVVPARQFAGVVPARNFTAEVQA